MDHTGIQPGEITAFLTDSTLCIGCKACEVACKEWNEIDADGFDLRLSQPGLGSFVEIVKSLFSRLDDPLYLCAARIVLSDLSGGMKRSPKIAKVRTETSRALVMHLREGIVRGEVRSTLKPEMAMTIILTGVCAVLELWLSDRSLDIVAAGEEFLAIMLHGLKANSD